MDVIDTSGWKQFKLVDIFTMKNTKSITAASLVPDSGDIPYVTAQEGNNGVQMYVDCPLEWLDRGRCILIGGKTLAFSYQDRDFCSNDSHNIALYTKDEAGQSLNVQLFLISTLKASLSPLFSWGDSISMRRAKGLSVMLPATENGSPNWVLMESTMREHMKQQEGELDALIALGRAIPLQIDTSEWGEFIVRELFKIERPRPRSVQSYEPGGVPFVASGDYENGVVGYCTPKPGEHLDEGNCVTVSPVDGGTTYQALPFLGRGGAGSSIFKLYNPSMNELSGLFIAAVVRARFSQLFGYSDMGNGEKIKEAALQLPSDVDGQPDWVAMERIMIEVIDQQKTKLDTFSAIVPVSHS
ncbi:restriction endonuclease subunit S [Glutamicibacter creatinolyticus]|uniref:restriction endonuclease subunit S n=1 Tax=Glutamicibacter creatinolyticus TaxID=162496 RepID=UPI003217D3A9